jgi:hypothetical protein
MQIEMLNAMHDLNLMSSFEEPGTGFLSSVKENTREFHHFPDWTNKVSLKENRIKSLVLTSGIITP